jgi:hypothetical protein
MQLLTSMCFLLSFPFVFVFFCFFSFFLSLLVCGSYLSRMQSLSNRPFPCFFLSLLLALYYFRHCLLARAIVGH